VTRVATLILSLALFACANDKIGSDPVRDSGFTLPDADAEPGCALGSSVAKPVPVDLIFAIDQSESMDGEIALVKKSINRLTDLLSATKLDYQVVMIARPGLDTYGVCIPPPLGNEGCGDNLPRFKRSAQEVLSKDALAIYLKTYDSTDPLLNWSKYIRTNSLKAFVPVTDDDATQPPPAPYWQTFDQQILARGDGTFGSSADRNYAFYPIIGAHIGDPTVKCSTEVVSNGEQYLQLAKLTNGKHFPVCATDYGPIFTEMADEIIGRVICAQPLPPPPPGQMLDPGRVNVRHVASDGKRTDFVKDDSKPCNEGANGWQFNADKTKILLCGDACKTARANAGGRVDVEFGCLTRVR
jgi:hypothetical protein